MNWCVLSCFILCFCSVWSGFSQHKVTDAVNACNVCAGDLSVGAEEQILGSNQPDMDDCVVGDNQDEEGEAMVEVSPSGRLSFQSFNLVVCM